MRRKKWSKRIHGAMLLSMMAGMMLASAAQAKIQWPFTPGKTWYICQGYNGKISHRGVQAIDISLNTTSAKSYMGVDQGCNPSTADASTNQIVVAPFSGTISSLGTTRDDMLCVTADDGIMSMGIGHLYPDSRAPMGFHVNVNQPIGKVAKPNSLPPEVNGNGEYAHFHGQLHKGKYCAGPLVPFENANGIDGQFYGLSEGMPYDGSLDQYAGSKPFTKPSPFSHPAGTLVQAYGENEVYFLQKVGDTLMKRYVTSPEALRTNGFDFPQIVSISMQEKSCYMKGADIVGFEQSTQFAGGLHEGQLIWLNSGSDAPVYIVSGGQLHWLHMSADEFAFAGFSFSNVTLKPGPYAIGRESTLQDFATCPNQPTIGPGTELIPVSGPKHQFPGDPYKHFCIYQPAIKCSLIDEDISENLCFLIRCAKKEAVYDQQNPAHPCTFICNPGYCG